MGHGDDLALVDANFPAISVARRLVRLDGADLPDAIAACLELLPLDTFVDNPRGARATGSCAGRTSRSAAALPGRDREGRGAARSLSGNRTQRVLRARQRGVCGDRDQRTEALRRHYR
jgi:hypothetical protein